MNIKGLDYNTSRPEIILQEYGREVQQMVQHALTLPDRRERQRCAETIIRIMQTLSPKVSEGDEQKYWHHLAVMARFKLDIDYPVDVSQAQRLTLRPERVPYNTTKGGHHYGGMLLQMFAKLKAMPAGKEREALAITTAHQMYHCLVQYGVSTASADRVAADLAHYTQGVISLDPSTLHFTAVTKSSGSSTKKKKKAKKK